MTCSEIMDEETLLSIIMDNWDRPHERWSRDPRTTWSVADHYPAARYRFPPYRTHGTPCSEDTDSRVPNQRRGRTLHSFPDGRR